MPYPQETSEEAGKCPGHEELSGVVKHRKQGTEGW